jgi:pimeloyl-[acyl-carrier protein] methyl ester esterase
MKNPPCLFMPGLGFSASFSQLLPMPCIDLNKIKGSANEAIPENTILIGWSLGSLFAIQLAAQFRNRFQKLILLAGTPAFSEHASWPGISPLEACKLIDLLKTQPEKFDRYFLPLLQFPVRNRQLKAKLKAHYQTPTIDLLQFLFMTDLREQFAALTLPIELYLGEIDPILPSKLLMNAFKQLNNNIKTTLVPNSSHVFFLENPDFFRKVVAC